MTRRAIRKLDRSKAMTLTATQQSARAGKQTASRADAMALVVDRPVAGHYRMRLVKGGPFVPVKIAPYGNEFSALVATVGGEHADLFETWVRCAGNPISKSGYDYMMAVK